LKIATIAEKGAILLEIAILQRNEGIFQMIDMILEATLKKDHKMEVGERELLLREDDEDQVQPLMIMKDEGEEDDLIVLPQIQIEDQKDKDEEELLHAPPLMIEDESIILAKKNLRDVGKMIEKIQKQNPTQTEE